MGNLIRKGFCKDCCANVNHARRFRSKLAWLVDTLTFRFVSRFRFGPWRCLQCTKKKNYLPLPRSNVKTIHIGKQPTDSNELVVEHGGNFLKREKSLVARRERCSRYSDKYRESIVQKILEGQIAIAEVRRELDLSEQDVLDWIAQAYDDQAHKIEELKAIIKALTDGQPMRIEVQDPLPAHAISGAPVRANQD